MGREVDPHAKGAESLHCFRGAGAFGGVHKPAEAAKDSDEALRSSEGVAGRTGTKDDVVEVLQQVDTAEAPLRVRSRTGLQSGRGKRT